MRISETIETRVKVYPSMKLHYPAHKFVSLRIAQSAKWCQATASSASQLAIRRTLTMYAHALAHVLPNCVAAASDAISLLSTAMLPFECIRSARRLAHSL